MELNTVLTYKPAECAVFFRVREEFGGLSNMASGFPLLVNGHEVRSSEALYQACRFPSRPEVQRHVIDQASPMAAKMVGKPHLAETRPDWDAARVPIMWWCLRLKWAQHPDKFGELLRSTGTQPIVERSRKDPFWGAVETIHGDLAGRNVLGRLLTWLRDSSPDNALVNVPQIPDFNLFGEPITPWIRSP